MRQLLKSLCIHSPWNYAVFWKLHCQGEMILSWEDGWFDYPKPSENAERMWEGTYAISDDQMCCSPCSEMHVKCGEYSINQLAAHMSCLQFKVGEGIVGEVANTGNHLWVFCDNISSGKVNSVSVLQCPDELLLQLAFGVKTFLLVPVLPDGVVQLGSSNMVAENLAMVTHIKEIFTIHNARTNAVSFTSSGQSLNKPTASIASLTKVDKSDTVRSTDSDKILTSISDQVGPFTSQNALWGCGKHLAGAEQFEIRSKFDPDPVYLSELSKSLGDGHKLERVENSMVGLSSREEELLVYSQFDKHNMELSEELYGGVMDYLPIENSTDPLLKNENQRHSVNLLNFPQDCELHKALVPSYQKHNNDCFLESLPSTGNRYSSSRWSSGEDLTDGLESSWFSQGGNAEYLLGSVFSNLYSGLDISLDGVFETGNSPMTPMGESSQPQNKIKADTFVGGDSGSSGHITSACLVGDSSDIISMAFRDDVGTFGSKEQQAKEYCRVEPRTPRKLPTVGKRRAKPGNNQKPRPRDRQLIQDRIKELRKLVPNGTKCSIDGLLDQTIKHMHYLRSITDQAEKLRQWAHHEVDVHKDSRSSETIDGNQNGTTFALEFGTELPVCPIVVEDLPYPGHILIEMLCGDHGLFLEIAHVIRSSQLTILKGVMEDRSNTTWAHFVVEASKGFHRMDIFWPLMHLLQSKVTPITSRI